MLARLGGFLGGSFSFSLGGDLDGVGPSGVGDGVDGGVRSLAALILGINVCANILFLFGLERIWLAWLKRRTAISTRWATHMLAARCGLRVHRFGVFVASVVVVSASILHVASAFEMNE